MSKYQQNDEPSKKITEYERGILYAFYGPVPATSNDEAVLLKVKNAVEAAEPELKRLRAENEKLQWELGKALDTLVVHDAVCAENEKLRAALKPFAGFSARYTQCFEETSQILLIKVCDLRAAAAALKETGDE